MSIYKSSHMKRYFGRLVTLLVLVMSISSCKKFVDIAPPNDKLLDEKVFSSNSAANSAMIGLYARMSQSLGFLNGTETIYLGLSADEFVNTVSSTVYDPFATNSLTSTNSTVFSMWNTAYSYIYQTNAILEGLASPTSVLTDSVRSQVKGEALVTRALIYFYLVQIYGDVPLVTTTDYRLNEVMPRTPASQIYQQLIEDLLMAKSLLKVNYASSGRFRPNRWTATALLARIYLYTQDWPNAELQSGEVIGSGMYTLVPSATINSTFLASSTETIWQVARENNNAAITSQFIVASGRPTFQLTTGLNNAFAAGDLRKTNWTATTVSGGTPYVYPHKYEQRTSANPGTESFILFRLAEQFLIRAEARAQQDKITDGRADLNIVRSRATAGGTIAAATKAELLAAIELERRLELFAEGGHRWMDLKRTNRINAVIGALRPANWQTTDSFFPIPFNEIQKNNNLTQNAGY
jgi:starch-binding outer membrane protein, SusD/RagB family